MDVVRSILELPEDDETSVEIKNKANGQISRHFLKSLTSNEDSLPYDDDLNSSLQQSSSKLLQERTLTLIPGSDNSAEDESPDSEPIIFENLTTIVPNPSKKDPNLSSTEVKASSLNNPTTFTTPIQNSTVSSTETPISSTASLPKFTEQISSPSPKSLNDYLSTTTQFPSPKSSLSSKFITGSPNLERVPRTTYAPPSNLRPTLSFETPPPRPSNWYTPSTLRTPVPYVIFGIFPNGTIFRKIPNSNHREIVSEAEIGNKNPYYPSSTETVVLYNNSKF